MPTMEVISRNTKLLIVFLLGLTAVPAATRQQYIFETLDIFDGLAQNSIMTIATDKYGFIWFGTEDGLDRHDGLEFKHFRHDPVDPTSLNSSSTLSSVVDSRGDLWIGTFASGINRYIYETESFQRYEPSATDSTSPGKGAVYALLEDHLGYIWVGTGSTGLYRMDPLAGVFTPLGNLLSPGDTLTDLAITSLFESHDHQLWIGTAYGLSVLDLDSYAITSYYSYQGRPESLTSNYVNHIYETFDGRDYHIWIATSSGGFDRFEPETETFIHQGYNSAVNPGFPDTDVSCMLQISADRFWLGTDSQGLLVMDAQGLLLDRILRKSYDDISLKDDIIQSLHDDGEIIWVGTLGGGVSKFSRNRKQFYNLIYDPLNTQGLHDNRILRIRGDSQGRLWIATWSKGLTLYDPERDTYRPFMHIEGDDHSLGSDDIQDILIDNKDNLWVTSDLYALNFLPAGSTRFELIEGSSDSTNGFNSDYPLTLFQDRAGLIWITTWEEGLISLDPDNMTFTTYTQPSVNDISLGSITPYSIFEDSRGMLWLGAESEGLVGFDRSSNTLIQYRSAPGDPYTLANNDIMCFHEDAQGIIWMGTYGGGLSRFDPESRTFDSFSIERGLLSEVIYSIFEDANGFLWMSTNNGLSRFEKQTGIFQNYGTSDGVLSQEFNPAGYQNKTGHMFFGGVKGITYFDPLQIKDNQHIPRVHFTSLSILNQPIEIGKPLGDRIVLHSSLILDPGLVLGPDHIMFTVQFASLDYAHPASNQFSYVLEGFDANWRDIGNQHDLTFTSLPPGDYVLRVKGSNNDGLWSEESADLRIRVVPAFVQTWWFKGALILFLALAIVTVFRTRTAFLRKRSDELRQHNIKLNAEIESRREAHRIARERADYFKAVISQSPVPMAIHNLDGNITQLNSGWVDLWEATDAEEIIRDYQVDNDPLAQKLDLGEKFKIAIGGQVVEEPDLIYEDSRGATRVIHLLLYPLRNEAGVTKQVMASIDDVTEIYHQRQLLEKSLAEKELLLKEVHHRVKNNLQIIASLLGLQKAGIRDPNIAIVLDDFRSRVNSMALVHEALYRSPEFDEVDVAVYLHGLLIDLQTAFEGNSRIKISSDIATLSLPVDLAVPCGLIINELVTNALKYAFQDSEGTDHEIKVVFRELEDDWLQIQISDNGRGFQKPVIWDSVESLGLYLVKILSEQQLMGRVGLTNGPGAQFSIEFPRHPNYDE